MAGGIGLQNCYVAETRARADILDFLEKNYNKKFAIKSHQHELNEGNFSFSNLNPYIFYVYPRDNPEVVFPIRSRYKSRFSEAEFIDKFYYTRKLVEHEKRRELKKLIEQKYPRSLHTNRTYFDLPANPPDIRKLNTYKKYAEAYPHTMSVHITLKLLEARLENKQKLRTLFKDVLRLYYKGAGELKFSILFYNPKHLGPGGDMKPLQKLAGYRWSLQWKLDVKNIQPGYLKKINDNVEKYIQINTNPKPEGL